MDHTRTPRKPINFQSSTTYDIKKDQSIGNSRSPTPTPDTHHIHDQPQYPHYTQRPDIIHNTHHRRRYDMNTSHHRNRNSHRYHHRHRYQRQLPYPSRSRSHSSSFSFSRSRSRSHSSSNSYSSHSRSRSRSISHHRRYGRTYDGHVNRHGRRYGRRRNRTDRRYGRHMVNTSDMQMNVKSVGHQRGPIPFKEFLNSMLDDDISPTEAQKRYTKYLQRFSKSDDVVFFEAHKDEEWFQERYDPIIIEHSINKRTKHAKDNYLLFYQMFINDTLPSIHDNINEYNININMNTNDTTTMTIIGSSLDDEKEEGEGTPPTPSTPIKHEHKHEPPLPKYADPKHKQTYSPNIFNKSEIIERDLALMAGIPSSAIESVIKNTNTECYQNSLFIQGIPLHIKRESLLKVFESSSGFVKLILSDPIRNSRKVRYGWVTYDSQESCRNVLLDVEMNGLNGYQLTSLYFMNLLPKQKSKRKPKISPMESLLESRVVHDIGVCLRSCQKFDGETGIVDNPMVDQIMLDALEPIRRLNLLLLYLRRIHFLCYYCGKHFLSEEHMFARCSGTHERKIPTISVHTTRNINDITHWEHDVNQRMNDVLKYIPDTKHSWIQRKELKMLDKNTKYVSEGKFRCLICSKLFKTAVFMTKHIKNKHSDEISKYIADQRLRTMFENYRRDRDRLTVHSFEDHDHSHNYMSGRKGNQGYRKMMQYQHRPPPRMSMPLHVFNHHSNAMPVPIPMVVIQQPPPMPNIIQHGIISQRMPPPVSVIVANASGVQSSVMPVDGSNVNVGGSHAVIMMNKDRVHSYGGRRIPVHFQEPATRTLRSYRDVDIEMVADDEVEEEIDYGFGDFISNPTGFHL